MPSVIVVGTQWGDEGKGKVIDLLTSHAQYVVRSQGGNNAGHTIMIGKEEYKLHLIPTGILHPHTQCCIGSGTVIDPEVLLQECRFLKSKGIDLTNRLSISPYAHVIFPYHKIMDQLLEQRKGAKSIGTTGKGIGPCYTDKTQRTGIRVGEWIDPEVFADCLKLAVTQKNEELKTLFGASPIVFDALYELYSQYAEAVRPFVSVETEITLHQALKRKESVLFEGAQGTFLDITLGTYPFVTSSSTTAAGICMGAGIGPSLIDHTLGVLKAYTTRVGHGPMPSELKENEIPFDHKTAREYGTTTGRKRRIGWFDAVLAQSAMRINGIDSLAVTKLDILDPLPEIKICIAYRIHGKVFQFPPVLNRDWEAVEPIYETIPGWQSSTSDMTTYDQLPKAAKYYLKRIEELCEVPIAIISVGPARDQTIVLKDPFLAPAEIA